MRLEAGAIGSLVRALRARGELDFKRDIQLAARSFGAETASAWFPESASIVNGDDTAALRSGDEFLLFAAEGMRAEFVASDPWFAGFCAVMVNVSDVAAMGGRPWAIVDVLFLGGGDNARVLEGMSKASEVFGVPVVGGHTARVSGGSMLAAAVLGRAKNLITSHAARPGQALVMAVDLRGSFRGPGGNFNAATAAPAKQLRATLAVLPELAEAGLVRAGKDISMAGLCGTVGMLLETSGVGAVLDLSAVPSPLDVDPERWLTAFPSYGYVLAVEPAQVAEVCARFDAVGVTAAPIGEVNSSRRLELRSHAADDAERAVYLDLDGSPLTGFGA
jgi:AIR synthase-related protein